MDGHRPIRAVPGDQRDLRRERGPGEQFAQRRRPDGLVLRAVVRQSETHATLGEVRHRDRPAAPVKRAAAEALAQRVPVAPVCQEYEDPEGRRRNGRG